MIARVAAFRYQLRRFLRFSEKAARASGLTPQQHQLLLGWRATPDVAGRPFRSWQNSYKRGTTPSWDWLNGRSGEGWSGKKGPDETTVLFGSTRQPGARRFSMSLPGFTGKNWRTSRRGS